MDQQAIRIKTLEAQTKRLSQLLDSEIFVKVFSQAVSSSLKISQGNKSASSSGVSRYAGKYYLEKLCLPRVAAGVK